MRLLEPDSFAEDVGVPADDEEAGLLGVQVDEEAAGGFVLRSICFFSGDPIGDFAADAAALEAGDDAFEYKLRFSMDVVVVRAL